MKQDTSWKEKTGPRLKKKADRNKDVFGNELPTKYEAEHYPEVMQAWLKSREPFGQMHASTKPTCDKCISADLPCTYPNCEPF